MKTHTLRIGTVCTHRDGRVTQHLLPVEFVAERLATITEYYSGDDTRGTTTTLYRTDDGRLVLYIETWSKWIGETNSYDLEQIQLDDLQPGGTYQHLGHEAGLSRAMTLDDALDLTHDAF